ncbi:MAG: ABC transporter permease, partial [Acidimicrobiia bacterium]|nr:ABC transporter permease [Acidimicrobiia bacterium]
MSARALLNRKSRRDLRRRRAQVIAVALTVLIGIAVFLLSASMASNLSRSYDLTYERTAFADLWVTGGSDDMASTLAAVDGVELIERRTSAEVGVRFADRPIRTRIVGFGPATTLNTLVVTAGSDLDPLGDGVIVEQHTADHFGLDPGAMIDIGGLGPVEVIGIAVSPEWLWVAPSQQELVVDPDEFGIVFLPEHLAATAAPEATQLVVTVTGNDPQLAESAAARAVATGAGEVLTRATHPSNQALQGDLEGFEQLSVMFPILFLAAAGLATGVLLSRLIAQQRAEIGMLRANGYTAAAIHRHYASYGVVVALLGALPALPLGIVGGFAATQAYTDFLGVPFASQSVEPSRWIVAIVFAAAVGGMSGALAARRATAVDPATAMRPGGGAVAGRRSVFERALPGRAPTWIRMSVRNIERAPGRAVTTALGIVLALMLTMTALVLNDTIDNIFASQFTETDPRGLVVTVAPGADVAQVADAVRAVDGVSVVESHLELGASLLADGKARA